MFRAGGAVPSAWIARHINAKEMYALHTLIAEYCAACPSTLCGTQVHVDVDNDSVVYMLNKGRARNMATHRLLVELFDLQARETFWFRLRWIPSASNAEADAMSRLGGDEYMRLRPHVSPLI